MNTPSSTMTLNPVTIANGTEPMPESSNRPNIRATKRKLDDAFQVLDDVVSPSNPIGRTSPPKKAHTIRSLYSTLAKYGIRSKAPRQPDSSTTKTDTGSLTKSTPHLTAILDRTASRTRKALPFGLSGPPTPAPVLPPTAEYRPSSIPAFLSRLATFKLATYANKPPAIDAVAASKCGWINDGKDRLVCGLCNNSWVVAGREGMSRDAANSLIEKQRTSLVTMHKDGCPWKTRQCDPSIYRIPLQSPAAMVRDIKSNAIELASPLQNIEVKHPLTLNQLNSIRSTISAFIMPLSDEPMETVQEDADVFTQAPSRAHTLPDAAILTSLFGWTIAPPVLPDSGRTALSRANSLTPSVSRASPVPSTPPLSRASSVSYQRPPSGAFSFRMPSNVSLKRENSLLQCSLCQRRVGLWAFIPPPSADPPPEAPQNQPSSTDDTAPTFPGFPVSTPSKPPAKTSQRQFDLLKEHRSYCPYVVHSTFVPSLSVSSSSTTLPSTLIYDHMRSNSSFSQLNGQSGGGALEGWRAVVTVVLRYGMGQRQRMGLDLMRESPTTEADDSGEPMEVDGIKAMVAGVKSRGGKDLLKYVKGLLG